VVIGAVLPLSGPHAARGEEIRTGLLLAAAEPAEGPPVELRILDGGGEPVASLRALRELASDPDVAGAIGGWLAAVARPLAAAPGADDLPCLALSPLAWPGPTPPGSAALRLHRLEALGAAAAAFASQDLGAERAGVLELPGREASGGLAAGFVRAFEAAGGAIVWRVAPDAEGLLRRPPGPEERIDVVWVAGPAGLLAGVPDLGEKAAAAPRLLPGGWGAGAEPGRPRDAAGAAYEVSFWSPTDPSPAARRFREACRTGGVDPTAPAAFGWDAMTLVRAALASGARDRESIARRLRDGPPVEGATGRLGAEPGSGGRENPAVSSRGESGDVFLRRVEAPVLRSAPAE
jgi:branched-chain amino acid transport system substrate-binding protein